MLPRSDIAVSKGPLGTPHVAIVANGHGIVGGDGNELTGHIGVFPTKGSPHGSRFLKVPKIDLNAMALKGFGIGFVHAVQGGQVGRKGP